MSPLKKGTAVKFSKSADNYIRSVCRSGATVFFIVPLTEGDSLGAKRQAGGPAGRNVSSRARPAGTWRVLDPLRKLCSRCPPLQGGQSPAHVQSSSSDNYIRSGFGQSRNLVVSFRRDGFYCPPHGDGTRDCPPCKGGQREQKLAQGVEHEPSCGRPGHDETFRPA